MPERRRPALWKTLVAAAQTAIDRVADGVDTLADGAEALADGLRSLAGEGHRAEGRRRGQPPPPTDPRLAGVDPALAAYVAAHDPVWFSFDAPGTSPQIDAGLASGWDAASAPIRRDTPLSAEPAAAPEQPMPRVHPRRGSPSAAELPAGRPVPPRVVFRRRRSEADDGRPSRAASADSAGAPPWRRSTPGAGAGTASSAEFTQRTSDPTDRSVRASPSTDAAAASTRSPTESESAPAPRGSFADTRSADATRSTDTRSTGIRSADPAPAIAFPTRPAPAEASSAVRPERTATRRQAPFEPLRHAPPAHHSPSSAAGLAQNAGPTRQPDRVPVPPTPAGATRSPAAAPMPAPWPELPPSSWSAPAADDSGALAWAGASATDVLVDEQRST